MTAVLHSAALAVTVMGLLAVLPALRASGSIRSALAVLLDFLTAAGLLRLAGDPAWDSVALAAAVVAVRKLVTTGLHATGS